MAHGFSESSNGVRYAEHISVPMRLFVGLLSAAMFLIPVPFVQHASTATPWPHLLLAAACVLAASAMGLLFMAIAMGRVLTLQFDAARRCMVRTSRWPLGARSTSIAFDQIAPPDIQRRESEDGPYYVLRLAVQGERPLQLGGFDRREEAEHWCHRIAALVRPGIHSAPG
ncbi:MULTISPECIES: hypothetical protein [unclassified Acidovorax]|uniref:hypothetical protein n=1 Tax=unclassified Acidovorax TaxID=2684926 RepID=UPI0006FD8AE1|nr:MULTISPECIES: hypothetical protein [unclassified Acidovorax]KRB37507.1 hypothetical protein ASD94_19900 [Acidovorax sp. Root70]PUA97181.1 hypothetical protein C8C99_2027 [Acidovorax sp. 107]